MDPRLQQILMRQQADGFPGLQGSEASIRLPVSDRLLNEILADGLTLPAKIRDVQLHSHPGNRIGVRIKVGGSFIPAINLTVVIERQPELPGSPVLVLKLELGGLLSMAGSALRFLEGLPPGIRVDHDHIYVDLAMLAEGRGLAQWLPYLDRLNLETAEGSLIVTLRVAVRGDAPS